MMHSKSYSYHIFHFILSQFISLRLILCLSHVVCFDEEKIKDFSIFAQRRLEDGIEWHRNSGTHQKHNKHVKNIESENFDK